MSDIILKFQKEVYIYTYFFVKYIYKNIINIHIYLIKYWKSLINKSNVYMYKIFKIIYDNLKIHFEISKFQIN